MKQVISIILFFVSFSSFSQNFEGDLTYKVTLCGTVKILDSVYNFKEMIASKNGYYDTTRFIIKDSVAKQQTLFSYGLKTIFYRYPDKQFYQIIGKKLTIENYNNPTKFNPSGPKLGEYISHKITDTLFMLDSVLKQAKSLIVENKFATETYIFSDSLPRLAFNKNILIEPNYLSYHPQIDSLISNSILLMYQVSNIKITGNNSYWRFELIEMNQRKVTKKEMVIPKYRETLKNKRNNKYFEHKKEYTIRKPMKL